MKNVRYLKFTSILYKLRYSTGFAVILYVVLCTQNYNESKVCIETNKMVSSTKN